MFIWLSSCSRMGALEKPKAEQRWSILGHSTPVRKGSAPLILHKKEKGSILPAVGSSEVGLMCNLALLSTKHSSFPGAGLLLWCCWADTQLAAFSQ